MILALDDKFNDRSGGDCLHSFYLFLPPIATAAKESSICCARLWWIIIFLFCRTWAAAHVWLWCTSPRSASCTSWRHYSLLFSFSCWALSSPWPSSIFLYWSHLSIHSCKLYCSFQDIVCPLCFLFHKLIATGLVATEFSASLNQFPGAATLQPHLLCVFLTSDRAVCVLEFSILSWIGWTFKAGSTQHGVSETYDARKCML